MCVAAPAFLILLMLILLSRVISTPMAGLSAALSGSRSPEGDEGATSSLATGVRERRDRAGVWSEPAQIVVGIPAVGSQGIARVTECRS